MVVAEDLSNTYSLLISKPPISNHLNDEEGSTSLLLLTDWVRILLLRDSFENPGAAIEVESFLPEMDKTVICKENATHSSINGCDIDIRDFARTMISHLDYLIRLCDYGFKMDFVGPDYLWTASYEIENTLNLDFFELLIPPS